RVEGEELGEFVDGEHERLGAAFAEVRVADGQLRVGAVRAAGVGFDHLFEVLARRQPLLGLNRRGALVEQEFVWFELPAWNDAAGAAAEAAGRRQGEGRDEEPERCRRAHAECASHRYSAVNPSSSETDGANPRSARARDVSVYVCRMSPF